MKVRRPSHVPGQWIGTWIGLSLSLLAACQEPARPNVVLIISDDQGWGDFGFMGSAEIRTPHLNALAAESLVFPRGYVPTALCRASLATLVTGLYPHQHKITGNDPPPGTDRARMLAHIRRPRARRAPRRRKA